MSDNPFLTSTPGLQPKTISVDGATRWIAEGWRMFLAAPGVWVALAAALIVIQLVLSMVPVLGGAASAILAPVFAGGIMAGCAALQRSQPLQFDCLFQGFRSNTGNLITVGVLYLAGILAIGLIVFLIGGSAAISLMAHRGGDMAANIGVAAGSLLLALLVGLLLFLPLAMALWFAPALAMLDGMTAAAAMKSSFSASLRNWLVFTLYGLLILVLGVLATIPLALGWLVLLPVLMGSIYASYRDIYSPP